MNYNKACRILKIEKNNNIVNIKKQYRVLALKYHPDKNKNSLESNEKFKEINEAYDYLLQYSEGEINVENNNYENIYNEFIKSLFESNTNNTVLISIFMNFIDIKNIDNSCLELIKKLDNDTAIFMYNTILKYREIFLLTDDFIDKIKDEINRKIKEDILITLNPSLDDLLEDNVYILKEKDNIFYVPLWHHEIHYKLNDKNKVIVFCNPQLDKNIEIHDNNDIILYKKININTLLENENIVINIGKKELILESKKLYIMKYQHFIFKNKGISIINNNNYYDNSNKSDIIVSIELFS